MTEAARRIRDGGVVAFPTETVYGLGANALDAAAVAQIFRIKGRPSTSPLIVHVASAAQARSLAREWPAPADLLAERYWPGPLTLVVPKQPAIPDIVTAGLPTVGLRLPAHPLAIALIEEAGVPIAAPSANRFTGLSPTSAEHVRLSLGPGVDCILDGGPSPVGIESTVLSLATPRPTLLRPGMITREEIEDLIGPVDTLSHAEGAHPAPGLHPRHYSPRTPLRLVDARPADACVFVSHREDDGADVRMPAEPFAYAAALYATLHRLDLERHPLIAVRRVPDSRAWAGIADRLRRAGEPA